MTIDFKKVLTGGLVAGIVLIIANVLATVVLGNRVQEDMNAWIPASGDRATPGGFAIGAGIIFKLIIGTMLVWLYAAIRPRFGLGPRTALYAAIAVWILGAIFFSDYLIIGMMSLATYTTVEVVQLVSFLLAGLAGARIYTEESPSAD